LGVPRIYILTDLEGVAGVARWDQTGATTRGYAQACRLMTLELCACVEGIHSAVPGADIWVWDGHGCGSIDLELFPSGARLINNGPTTPPTLLDRSFDALFFLGQHAMAGTPAANLAHTYSSEHIARMRVNGSDMGEFGCRAALAGSMGVPTLFVSGDDKIAAEARALVPDIVTAEVKVGYAPQLALHLAPVDARDVIRQKAASATTMIGQVRPLVIPGPPYTHEITITGRTDPDGYLARGYTQINATTFIKTTSDLALLAI